MRMIIIFLLVMKSSTLLSQNEDYPFDFFSFRVQPSKHNSFFVKNDNIDWAIQFFNRISFADNIKVYDNLLNNQLENKIQNFITKSWLEYNKNFTLIEDPKEDANDYLKVKLKKEEVNYTQESYDALGNVEFDQILYLENNRLKSFIIAAGAQIKVFTSNGLYLGNTTIAYSYLNSLIKSNFNSNPISTTYQIFKIDSLEERSSLKKNYNMNLIFTLWNKCSLGFCNAIDLKRNKSIDPKNIIDYSVYDSTEQLFCGDTIYPTKVMIPGAPARFYFSHIGIPQEWFFDKKKKVFYSRINEIYLYTKEFLGNGKLAYNKSIKIVF